MTEPQRTPQLVALTNEHLPQALALSKALNWPYREEDWRFALALGHGIAVEANHQLIGTALWWPYEPAFATCGMIIVSNAYQRQGIGRLLMDELMRQAQGRTLILCSTRAGQRLYEHAGFKGYGSVYQHQGVLTTAPTVPIEKGIRPYQAADLAALCAVDRRAAGMDRTGMLAALLEVGHFAVLDRAGIISGYACLRRWGRGWVIGPVIAATTADAQSLIATQLMAHVGDFVRLDVTAACGLSPWLNEIGLARVDDVALMARGERPRQDANATLFALANQSLG